MRPRHARRLAERVERKRNTARVAPAGRVSMHHNERRQAVVAAGQRCVVCGGQDGPECTSCTTDWDKRIERSADL